MKENIKILGVPFSNANMKETIEVIAHQVENNNERVFHVITGNPEIVLQCEKDNELKKVIYECDLITPDGVGIVLASKWKGAPLEERVTGYDLLLEVLKKGDEKEWSFYLLGADEESSKKAAENILKQYPSVRIVGRQHGYFNSGEEEAILKDIENKKPDILVVALGAPRAEKWIYNNKGSLPAKVAITVGGSLDGISGKVKRAPEIWQKLNIEWLFRLINEPSRWRRQRVLPVFAYKAFAEAIKERRKK